jgi:hypothetical protein
LREQVYKTKSWAVAVMDIRHSNVILEVEMPVVFAEIGALITGDPALQRGACRLSPAQAFAYELAIENNRGVTPKEIDADIAAEEQAYDEDAAQRRLIAALRKPRH